MRSVALWKLRLLIACVALGPFMAGCLLMTARTEESTQTATDGSQTVTFYSSDTNGEALEQSLDLGERQMRVQVTFNAKVDSGELHIEVLNGQDRELAFTVEGSKAGSSGTGIVRTDDVGHLRYRLRTTNARNGAYSFSYMPPPTPTPTPTPTSTPQPTDTPTPTATPTSTPTDTPTLPVVEATATP
jgi:hypothetical protein